MAQFIVALSRMHLDCLLVSHRVPIHTRTGCVGSGESARVSLAVDNNRERAEQRLRTWFGVRYKNADMASCVSIWGSRAECLDQLGDLVWAEARHLMLNPVFDDMDQVELLAQDIVPHLCP